MPTNGQDPFDAIVIGTGFAGAVTACRLVQAGLRICVLERGRRFEQGDFPKYPTEDLFVLDDDREKHYAPPPDFSRWLWNLDRGIYDIRDLGDTVSVQAAGYGGGSLIYANVHLRPPPEVFEHGWPSEYKPNRAAGSWSLTPYFDLAAYMLQVGPIPQRLRKTLQHRRAAEALNAGANVDDYWFRTPLAVTFGEKPNANPWNRVQQPCDMRGRCYLGCDNQSKNTLDVNYLARAEQAPVKPGEQTPDIRTLAEVVSIDKPDKPNGEYVVTYQDLIYRDGKRARDDAEGDGAKGNGPQAGEPPKECVRAKHVFLCAGAVNTTQLLFENSVRLFDEDKCPAALGSHYFPNADSFSMFFDCDEPHEADYGPTITSALLHRSRSDGGTTRSLDFHSGTDEKKERRPRAGATVKCRDDNDQIVAKGILAHDPWLDWGAWDNGDAVGALVLDDVSGSFDDDKTITIEDGGYEWTATTRGNDSPRWDWFLAEDGGYPPDLEPLLGIFRSPLWLRRNRYLEDDRLDLLGQPLMPERQVPLRRPHRQRLRVQTIAEALGGSGSRLASPGGLVARTIDQGRLQQGGKGNTDFLERALWGMLPPWLQTTLERDRQDLVEMVVAFAEPMVGELLDDLAENIAMQVDDRTFERMGFGKAELSDERKQVLIRGLVRQGMQLVAGSEAGAAWKGAELFIDALPSSPLKLLERAGDLVLWALAYRASEGHTGMLLTMGRDLHRGRLCVRNDRGEVIPLAAKLPHELLTTSRDTQEQVLRAIAKDGWRGELRTNPAWTPLGTRVTVHSQGGCPMGTQGLSVTDQWGEVHDRKGLYVMDAAAFPTSVGVNPSAAIAAVAEFKVEHFVREHGQHIAAGENPLWDPRWETDDKRPAAQYMADMKKAGVDLDPLGSREPVVTPPPGLGDITLSFDEMMEGFYAPSAVDIDLSDLGAFPDLVPGFLAPESHGIRAGQQIRTDLTATARDLTELLSPERAGRPAKVDVTGAITLYKWKGAAEVKMPLVAGAPNFLQLFVPHPKEARTKFFRYVLTCGDGSDTFTLTGLKVLRDDPKFDVWRDTSTLYFKIENTKTSQRWGGVLYLPANEFLKTQLPSLDVQGTTDPARRAWAAAAFYRYFAKGLKQVYTRDTKRLSELLKNMLTRINA